jgi:hypothetical protein
MVSALEIYLSSLKKKWFIRLVSPDWIMIPYILPLLCIGLSSLLKKGQKSVYIPGSKIKRT